MLLPFGVEIDLHAIKIWFGDVYTQCIPDFESLLNEKLSTTFALFTNRLFIAASTTLNAVKSWIKLVFYFCRLIIHIILLSYPYIKPMVIGSYNYWNSLDLTVQLSIIGFILFILISIWIKKNDYIGRANTYFHDKLHKIRHWFALKWHQLIKWIAVRSQMTAKILPHLIWWIIICILIWFSPQHIYASHHVLLFIGCFIIPTLKTYSVLRKYDDYAKLYSIEAYTQEIDECIHPLQSWLQFWCCRAFILFTYYLCCYLLSYIPVSVIDYIDINHTLFAILCDWSILWFLVMDSSLSYFVKQLNTSIFQLNTSIRSQPRTKIRSSASLADKISLSSINSVLRVILRFIRPIVPTFVYYIVHDGLYQFLIFFIFLFFSPSLGSYVLGYLLPIYTSILALNDLNKLQHKISLWNNNKRNELITPHPSMEPRSPLSMSDQQLRSRKPLNADSPIHHKKEKPKSWSLWSIMPLSMFSFHGTDDLDKNERKRQEMHNEANYVIKTIVDRLKYWVVFASFEWIYYFIGEQIGLQNYIPLWNHAKFAFILWMQLPYIPYNSLKLYEYVILPFKILDIHHIDVTKKKDDDAKQNDE